MQRLQRERRVAHPRVAVVPVPLAAAASRAARSCSAATVAPGRHVGQALDRQRRTLERVRSGWSGIRARASQPRQNATVASIRAYGVLGVRRRGQVLGPGERAERLARPCVQHVPGAHRAALDPDEHVGAEPEGLTGAGRVGGVTVPSTQRPGGRHPAVVERRLADQLDLDRALEALDRAHQHVVGVVVGRRPGVRRDRVRALPGPHRQGVVDQHPATRGVPRRRHHVGAGHVGAGGRHVDAVRAEPERAGATVEQVAEARWASRRRAGTASRPSRPARPGRRCGSSTGTRSRRSAGRGTSRGSRRGSFRRDSGGPAVAVSTIERCASRRASPRADD